jgi:type VI secretion system protein ImpA
LKWLDDKLPLALAKVPLVQPPTPGAATYTFGDWRQLLLREKRAGTRQRSDTSDEEESSGGEEPPLDRERFLAAAALMPGAALTLLARQVDGAHEAASALEKALDARLDQPAAALRRTRSTLEDLQALLSSWRGKAARDEPDATAGMTPTLPLPLGPAPSEPASAMDAPESPREPEAVPLAPRALQDRAEAYRMLSLAADFLLRTEPHSPVPYLVQRAIAWGEMPLSQLLVELVPGSEAREDIQSLLGMTPAK